MPDAFAAAVAALHADPNLAQPAEYQAPGGSTWLPVRVVLATPVEPLGVARPGGQAAAREAWLRAAEQVPQRNGALRIGAVTWRIAAVEPDDLGLSHRCTLAA